MNVISILLGCFAAIFMFVGFIPFLGWLNWVALFFAAFGAILGALSKKRAGLIICVIVIIVGGLRLFIGGGIL